MTIRTDDTRIEQSGELCTPMQLMQDLPVSEHILEVVSQGRARIHDVLRGADDRMFIVVGPCSIHDPVAALEYAQAQTILEQHIRYTMQAISDGAPLPANGTESVCQYCDVRGLCRKGAW